ncbi:hypothetical protein GCM10027612_51800 [Microbispora bryophytorum subsp. camponoti]
MRAASAKRQRLMAAAAEVVHQQGAERTTIADIARAADVPVGNVYYYFKTKDELVAAALAEHARHLRDLTERLERLPDPGSGSRAWWRRGSAGAISRPGTAARPARSPPSWTNATRAAWTRRRAG